MLISINGHGLHLGIVEDIIATIGENVAICALDRCARSHITREKTKTKTKAMHGHLLVATAMNTNRRTEEGAANEPASRSRTSSLDCGGSLRHLLILGSGCHFVFGVHVRATVSCQ